MCFKSFVVLFCLFLPILPKCIISKFQSLEITSCIFNIKQSYSYIGRVLYFFLLFLFCLSVAYELPMREVS